MSGKRIWQRNEKLKSWKKWLSSLFSTTDEAVGSYNSLQKCQWLKREIDESQTVISDKRLSNIFQNILEPEGAIREEKDIMMINGHLSSR